MSVIQEIATQRQKLLDGISANDGDINLSIFEDFYPDEAHFIYEMLQNAEDADATEVSFELTQDGCSFEHNGTRHFDERDIRGITGIYNSNKREHTDKIGKFGIGFKSVFIYTKSPAVYSKDFSFRIVEKVLPEEISPKPNLGQRTRFEFPFNNPEKNAEKAYADVKAGLEQLSETTLLYLRNLSYIKWKIGLQEGAVLRDQHSECHIEVLKVVDGKELPSSHWLRFAVPLQDVTTHSTPVERVGRKQVAVAYELALTGDAKSFDKSAPLKQQFRIVPAARGKVSVFFPADKETSGLRFHLHGPFIPELSRASIKNSPENLPLFDQLATLAAKSLHTIRELGLLTGEFLGVLPNDDDELPPRYRVIRKAIIDEMQSAPLVPIHKSKQHAPATKLLQAKATLKDLLTTEDLAFVTGRDDDPQWAIGATQKHTNQDRMLSSLRIKSWDAEDLKSFFEEKARDCSDIWDEREANQEVLDWLEGQSTEWLQALYAILLKHCEVAGYDDLPTVSFVKLTSGEWGIATESFFQTGPTTISDRRHYVDEEVLTAGTKKQQQQEARRFLEELGVREPNEADAMEQLLEDRYGDGVEPPGDKEYREDLKQMISFLEKNPSRGDLFFGARVFKTSSPQTTWRTAAKVYLDKPFGTTNLKLLYDITTDQKQKRWPLDNWYVDCGIAIEKVIKFAENLGCERAFDRLFIEARCEQNRSWSHLRTAPGRRAGNFRNDDFALAPDALLLLNSRNSESVQLVWKALCQRSSRYPNILQARYQITDSGGPRTSESQLVHSLREMAWVPQTDGAFVRPREALVNLLPRGFTVDAGYKWLEVVAFGSAEKKRTSENVARAAHRVEVGFKSEDDLQDALEFIRKVPKEERQRFLESAQRELEPIELPERSVGNPELRDQRVRAEARDTPEKAASIRQRSIQLGASEAKTAAKGYLRDQYTNPNGQMICQACKDELPFKLPTGAYYFETVEMIADSEKRHRATYLALCPNHAAAYQYANGQRNSIGDLVATAASDELEVNLGGEQTTIYFTRTHLADAKSCLAADDND